MTLKTLFAPLALAAGVALAVPAVAATLSEAGVSGGDFGNAPARATLVAADVETVTGSQTSRIDSDFLSFSGFRPGTRSLDFTFTNPGGAWGGFNIRLKTTPLQNPQDWWPLAFWETVPKVTDSQPKTISYVLNGHTGPLHVAIDFFDADFRNGNGVSYTINARGAPEPAQSAAPVPLPASLPLALAGLASFAVAARLRRRS